MNVFMDIETYFRTKVRSAILGTASQMVQTQYEAQKMSDSQGDIVPVYTETVEDLIKCIALDAIEFLIDCEIAEVKLVHFNKEMLRDYALNLVWDDKDLNGALAMMALTLKGFKINTDTFGIILKESDVRNHYEVE